MDPNTYGFEVGLELTEASGHAFAELTGAHVGQKLAIILGDTVSSAPVIMTRIDGNRLSIRMGGSDPTVQQQQAYVLAAALRDVPLPVPARALGIESLPATHAAELWLARLLVAALAATFVFFSSLFLRRWLTIYREPELESVLATATEAQTGSTSSWPWSAVAVSVASVAAMLLGYRVLVPGLDRRALEDIAGGDMPWLGFPELSMFALGLMPFVSAYLLVELAALVMPRWRSLRISGPAARARLDLAVMILGILLALLQSYFVAVWLEALGQGGRFAVDDGFSGLGVVPDPGMTFRLLTMATLTAGSVCLVALAMFISRRGLGDGFAVLLVVGPVLAAVGILWPHQPSGTLAPPENGPLGIAVPLGVIALTAAVLRLRAGPAASRRGLRIPAGGLVPISWATSLLLLVPLLSGLGIEMPQALIELTPGSTRYLLVLGALVLPLTALFAALLARCYRPSRPRLIAAIMVSAIILFAYLGLQHVSSRLGPWVVVEIVSATAIGMDLWVELVARRRRRDWVAVWPMHRVMLVDSAVEALRQQGIDTFVRGVYFRSLLHFFGPFVAATVFVPKEHGQRAREILHALLVDRGSVSTAPAAA